MPSKRITWRNAKILRWLLVPACWILSAFYSVETVYASIALCILTFIYDEMGASAGHWFLRNFVNALGFMAFEVGACLVAGTPQFGRILAMSSLTILSSVLRRKPARIG